MNQLRKRNLKFDTSISPSFVHSRNRNRKKKSKIRDCRDYEQLPFLRVIFEVSSLQFLLAASIRKKLLYHYQKKKICKNASLAEESQFQFSLLNHITSSFCYLKIHSKKLYLGNLMCKQQTIFVMSFQELTLKMIYLSHLLEQNLRYHPGNPASNCMIKYLFKVSNKDTNITSIHVIVVSLLLTWSRICQQVAKQLTRFLFKTRL